MWSWFSKSCIAIWVIIRNSETSGQFRLCLKPYKYLIGTSLRCPYGKSHRSLCPLVNAVRIFRVNHKSEPFFSVWGWKFIHRNNCYKLGL